ncbi:flippase [Alcanivorax sp. ZXX171]|nr:flippase [Alcanivorax sp. ZXX171]
MVVAVATRNQVLFSLALRPFNVLLSFLCTIFFARMLGAEAFGRYSFVLALLTFISVPIQSALPTLVLREVAKEPQKKSPIIKWAKKVSLLYWFFGAITLLTIGRFYNNGAQIDLFLIALFSMPFMAIAMIKSAEIKARGAVVVGQVADAVIRPGGILLICIVWFFLFGQIADFDLLIFYLVSVLLMLLFNQMASDGLCKINCQDLPSKQPEEWRKTLIPLTFLAGFQVLNAQLDIIVVGFIESDENTGIYRVAVQLSLLVAMIITGVNQAIQPRISLLYSRGDRVELEEVVKRSSIIILLLTLFPAIILLTFGTYLIPLLFGEVYLAGYSSLIFLVLAQLINAGFGSVGAILNMSGHERYTVMGMFAAFCVNLVMDILLVPVLGILGAALSTCISFLVWNLILWKMVKVKLGIESAGFINVLRFRGDRK